MTAVLAANTRRAVSLHRSSAVPSRQLFFRSGRFRGRGAGLAVPASCRALRPTLLLLPAPVLVGHHRFGQQLGQTGVLAQLLGRVTTSLGFDRPNSRLGVRFRVRAINRVGAGSWSNWSPRVTIK